MNVGGVFCLHHDGHIVRVLCQPPVVASICDLVDCKDFLVREEAKSTSCLMLEGREQEMAFRQSSFSLTLTEHLARTGDIRMVAQILMNIVDDCCPTDVQLGRQIAHRSARISINQRLQSVDKVLAALSAH